MNQGSSKPGWCPSDSVQEQECQVEQHAVSRKSVSSANKVCGEGLNKQEEQAGKNTKEGSRADNIILAREHVPSNHVGMTPQDDTNKSRQAFSIYQNESTENHSQERIRSK